MNNNQLTIVKEYTVDNPLIQNINSIISECYRECFLQLPTNSTAGEISQQYLPTIRFQCSTFVEIE